MQRSHRPPMAARFLRHGMDAGGWRLLTRGAITLTRGGLVGIAGARDALPRGALQVQAGAGVHHRHAPSVNGGDDLL